MSSFEKKWEELGVVNQHSVYTKCFSCNNWGINLPGEKACGNCGSLETLVYIDEETVNLIAKKQSSLGAQEALQRVQGEVIVATNPQEIGYRSRRKIIKEQRTKLTKLREEYV